MRIACVLNRSETYDSDYVVKLLDGIAKQTKDFQFLVVHNTRWSGWWSKLSLFDPETRGDLLYFDLDTVIAGSLDDIARIGRLTVLSDFNRLHKMASGVMFLPEKERGRIWSAWIDNPEGHMAKWGGAGDQGFLSQFWEAGNNPWLKADRWQDVLPGQIVSYKLHCKDGLPNNARVVCYHGRPRPRETGWKIDGAL